MRSNFYRPIILDNGLTLFLKDIPDSKFIHVRARVMMGACDETLTRDKGICNLIEKMVWRGTQDLSGSQIASARMKAGGSIDGQVKLDHTDYTAAVAPDEFEPTMFLMDSIVFRPELDANELDIEKKLVEIHMASENACPLAFAKKNNIRHLFPEHNVAFGINGTRETIRDIKITRMREFVRNFHRPQTVMLGLAGPLIDYVNMEIVLDQQAKGYIKKTRAANQIPLNRKWGNPKPIEEWDKVVERGEQDYCVQVITFPIPSSIVTSDAHSILCLKVLTEMFGNAPASIVRQRLTASKGIASDVVAELTALEDIAWISISLKTTSKQSNTTEMVIRQTMDEIANGKTPLLDINNAIAAVRNEIRIIKSAPGSFLKHCMECHLIGSDPRDYDETAGKIEASDIKDIASKIVSIGSGFTYTKGMI